jgi:hypothetical protein
MRRFHQYISCFICILCWLNTLSSEEEDVCSIDNATCRQNSISSSITRFQYDNLSYNYNLHAPFILKDYFAEEALASFTLSIAVQSIYRNVSTISNLYKQTKNRFFGPYYDPRRPYHSLKGVAVINEYDANVTVTGEEFEQIFASTVSQDRDHPPYWTYISPLKAIDPHNQLENALTSIGKQVLNTSQLFSTSMNAWFGRAPGTTPCHYDGYHNFYLQLYGSKRFILIKPDIMDEILSSYPFPHPSYGQCQGNLSALDLDIYSSRLQEAIIVNLKPGELLYIPPFWIHEVICGCSICTLRSSLNIGRVGRNTRFILISEHMGRYPRVSFV